MSETRTDAVTVDDGRFDLHLWTPAAGHGPGLVLYQEIFGVGGYIRSVADRLCDLGYVVGAPDLFWRHQPNWAPAPDEAGMAAAMQLVQKVDPSLAVADSVASLHRLAELPEVDGRPGVIGFCFGGTMAWMVAAEADPSCCVSYYGSGVADAAERIADINCPAILHFGGDDPFIPAEHPAKVEALAADRHDVTVHVHDGAGHAFDNHESPIFHVPGAASVAWAITTAFLAQNLPVG